MAKFTIGDEVVRSKGDYVVGRVGVITEIDEVKGRVKGTWGTWVKEDCMELTSIPYEIIPFTEGKVNGRYRFSNPKYIRK